ncbi:MAG TPA: hypothetical protein VFL77_11425 [Solirubrobacterales bacterium]|nr:hypothetical protein [Solirubrobacterales bacterium]
MVERLIIRILLATALGLSLLAFVLVPIPVDATGDPDLPAPAFEQPDLYRLEVGLMVFYGNLLLMTPACTGLARGRLPIEISTRGARFAEQADRSAAQDGAAIERLEATTDRLALKLAEARTEIERLEELASSDRTQPEVISER